MTWGKTLGISFIVSLVLWLIFGYVYGDFVLADSVVPEKGVTIDDWLSAYYLAAGISAFFAWVFNIAWYIMGVNFAGGSGISTRYYVLWGLTLILGLGAAFGFMEPAVEGNGVSTFFAIFLAPMAFYLDSVFASADAVKFIPPFRG
ncbi:hypothetical protein [Mitsuokella jalaludinii]|uniref:hypothetical protein n=1 Tax=Mitsuokella jalaludinii TaxID=187979 RepID=UPI003F996E07